VLHNKQNIQKEVFTPTFSDWLCNKCKATTVKLNNETLHYNY